MSETTWFITGASSGLGYSLAEHVLQQGERVAMGARTLGPMSDLAQRYPDSGLALKLDVTDPDQRATAVQVTVDHFGSIDVLVNNAAVDFLGAVEEQDEAAYRATFEVNFFAPVETHASRAAGHAQPEARHDRQYFVDGWSRERASQWHLLGQ